MRINGAIAETSPVCSGLKSGWNKSILVLVVSRSWEKFNLWVLWLSRIGTYYHHYWWRITLWACIRSWEGSRVLLVAVDI